MSAFMSPIFCAGFKDMPPVSKVIPFPISTVGWLAAPVGWCSRVINLGPTAEPCPTASKALSPSSLAASSSMFSNSRPVSSAISMARAASESGRFILLGVLTRSRAQQVASAIFWARVVALAISTGAAIRISSSPTSSVEAALNSRYRYDVRMAASVAAVASSSKSCPSISGSGTAILLLPRWRALLVPLATARRQASRSISADVPSPTSISSRQRFPGVERARVCPRLP